jgi:putative transposase
MGRYQVSQRRATRAARFCLSSIQSCRDPLTALRQRMRELAQTCVRFGYRRLLVLLRREGWELGKKRCYRLYIEEGLALRRKRPWRHATAVHREQRRPATARNDIWSMDFVADQLADGRRVRALTVLDLFTRECLVIDVGQGLSGSDVVATLERLRFERGLPRCIYCDNGTEFVSAAMDLWAYTNGVILDFSRRGKPTDNAAIESFNGRFREECLNVHWFASIEDAQQKVDTFRWDYNEHHPHRSFKGLSPREFAERMLQTAADSPPHAAGEGSWRVWQIVGTWPMSREGHDVVMSVVARLHESVRAQPDHTETNASDHQEDPVERRDMERQVPHVVDVQQVVIHQALDEVE